MCRGTGWCLLWGLAHFFTEKHCDRPSESWRTSKPANQVSTSLRGLQSRGSCDAILSSRLRSLDGGTQALVWALDPRGKENLESLWIRRMGKGSQAGCVGMRLLFLLVLLHLVSHMAGWSSFASREQLWKWVHQLIRQSFLQIINKHPRGSPIIRT